MLGLKLNHVSKGATGGQCLGCHPGTFHDESYGSLGPFPISLLSQLKAKSLSQPCNLLQNRFISRVQARNLGEILT